MLCLAKRMAKNREHLYCKIFMVNQHTASWESTCSPQDFHGQSIALMKSVQLVQSHSGMELKTTEKASQRKLKGIHTRVQSQWLPEDTSDALLYFLTTCTALCRRGTLKCLLMSVIIVKRVSCEHRHQRKLRLKSTTFDFQHCNNWMQQTQSPFILSLSMTNSCSSPSSSSDNEPYCVSK